MDSIEKYADNLATGGLTVGALRALDWVAPGQWENTVGFDNLVRQVTGETDPQLLAQVRARALELFADTNQGYQRALWIYQAVDSTDKKLGMAAIGNKLSERFSLLSWIGKITPKADTTQTIDLSVKIVAELAAFCYVNGLPGDSIGDFVGALGAYERESLIRMAALVCFDGLVPLGPEFLQKSQELLGRLNPAELEGNATFSAIKSMIPGGNTLGQLGFMGQAFGGITGWVGNFVQQHNLTPEAVAGRLSHLVEGADGRLDYLGGFLDMYTDYYAHTGTQSLCRSLITRAVAEI